MQLAAVVPADSKEAHQTSTSAWLLMELKGNTAESGCVDHAAMFLILMPWTQRPDQRSTQHLVSGTEICNMGM